MELNNLIDSFYYKLEYKLEYYILDDKNYIERYKDFNGNL